MGIHFGDITPVENTAVSAAEINGAAAVSTPQGITLDLNKGAVLDLEKSSPGLKKVMVGASWDTAQAGEDFDLDISALLIHAGGKIATADDIIYFNHMEASGVKLNKDNRTGAGDGDDETIDIDLDAIPQSITGIVFVVNIFEAQERRQTFGMVNNSGIRLVDKEADKEICRFSLKDDYASSTGIVFAKLVRENGAWKFEAVGEGKVVRDLNGFVEMFS